MTTHHINHIHNSHLFMMFHLFILIHISIIILVIFAQKFTREKWLVIVRQAYNVLSFVWISTNKIYRWKIKFRKEYLLDVCQYKIDIVFQNIECLFIHEMTKMTKMKWNENTWQSRVSKLIRRRVDGKLNVKIFTLQKKDSLNSLFHFSVDTLGKMYIQLLY